MSDDNYSFDILSISLSFASMIIYSSTPANSLEDFAKTHECGLSVTNYFCIVYGQGIWILEKATSELKLPY